MNHQALQLDIDVDCVPKDVELSVSPIKNPIERYLQDHVLKIQSEYSLFVRNMAEISKSHEALEKDYETLYLGSNQRVFIRETYGRILSLIGHLAIEAIKEIGISNFELPGSLSCTEQGNNPQKWETPLAYWKRVTGDLDSYRREGLRKHADILANQLLGLDERDATHGRVGPNKLGFSVVVSAWLSHYSFESGYSYDCKNRLYRILDSIKEVVFSNGLDNSFMHHRVTSLFEDVTSRAKDEYCKGVTLQTFKGKVVFQLSFEVMEAIQLFINEHRPQE